jgi:hypothetical protein
MVLYVANGRKINSLFGNILTKIIPDTIANIKQKSLHGRYFKELEQPEVNVQASHARLKKSNIHPETEGLYLQYKIVL